MPEVQLFVVGMNGSGTTMLADSLGLHEQVFMFPFESKLIPLYLRRAPRFGDLREPGPRRRLADEIGRALPFWRANGRQALRLADDALAPASNVAELFDCIFRALARAAGKRGWVEKSPGNIEHMAALAAAFPRARFIHIIRDGRDAAQSFHRRWWFDPRHTIWRWKHCVRIGRQAGAALGPERYLELRYEDLTADPEQWMRRVCAFAGLPFSPAVLGSSMRHMAVPADPSRPGTIVANSQRWRGYFDPSRVRALEQLAGRVLAELGYEVEQAGDDDLGRAERIALRGKDALMRSLAFFRDRGLKGVPMYLRLVGNALKTRSVRRY